MYRAFYKVRTLPWGRETRGVVAGLVVDSNLYLATLEVGGTLLG